MLIGQRETIGQRHRRQGSSCWDDADQMLADDETMDVTQSRHTTEEGVVSEEDEPTESTVQKVSPVQKAGWCEATISIAGGHEVIGFLGRARDGGWLYKWSVR